MGAYIEPRDYGAPDGGPTLLGGGIRVYHSCGEPVTIWGSWRRIDQLLPALCPRCRDQIWSTGVKEGRLTRRQLVQGGEGGRHEVGR